ncbi:MAG: amino acid adenylation domain-containing protein [Candidatus Aminicenantes bacterium]|nr:MAG: amino acid adenylation domain-containing protein [Candidatus Aminicenantes bacterium]
MKEKPFQILLYKGLKKFKHRTAVEYGNRLITYGELDRRSDVIANWMMKNDIKEETFIGILANDRIVVILSIIAILKAKSVFVPLDTSNPPDRLGEMIEITKLRLIFTDKESGMKYSTGSSIKEKNIKLVIIEDLPRLTDEIEPNFRKRLTANCSPEDKIYIFFTSGTTGEPKAVVGKNRSLLHYIQWEVNTFNLDKNFRINQFAPIGFDAFLKEVFVTFFAGGTLCIPENLEVILTPEELAEWMGKKRINLLHCVPAIFRLLNPNKLTGSHFPHLMYILLSGEEIYPSDLKDWYGTFAERIQIVNLYGTTETTILNSYYLIQKSDTNRERIPIGSPIKGTRIIILDENMKACKKGVVGEIYIQTRYRTFGYYNSPALNMERFIPNPFTNNPGEIMFKTGDSGRFLFDGTIEYLGRKDRQVKIRGMRVELGEIECILLKHPLVKEVVVVKEKVSNNNKLLSAYVVGNGENETGQETFLSTLKDYLLGKLPNYMVPTHIIKIERIPRKHNRKVDYEALTSLYKDKNIFPRNDIEKKLLEIWKIILKVENLGVRNSFFEVGGNSLNVMSLISKVHQEFNYRIPIAQIFYRPTIEEQAAIIKEGDFKEE